MTMTNIYWRAIRIAYYSDLHATRWTLGLAEMLWCITLLWPGDTFERPTYGLMGKVMPEMAWAFLFGITGAIQLAILLSGKYHDRAAVLFSAYNALLWIFICACMCLSVYPPPAAISGELAIALSAAWVFVRSGYTTDRRGGGARAD